MKRRDFIRKLGQGYLAASIAFLDNPFRPRFRIARAASGKTLIVVFQKGGCDGLNTVIPYTEQSYYDYRPTIAIPAPDPGNPESAIPLDGMYGLHPALAPLEEIFFAGDLAILPTVHYPNGALSHFDSQPLIETAASVPDQGLDGWLNRHLVSQASSARLRSIGYVADEDAGLPDSLRGPAIASTFADMTNFHLDLSPAEQAALLERLTPIYEQTGDPGKIYSKLVHDYGRAVINDVAVLGSIDFSGYVPANGAVYPDTGFGRAMKQTAQLIKEGIGLEIAALTLHKWDHHQLQGGGQPSGRHYRSLAEFGGAIGALYRDLGPMMNEVVLMTSTEFGRTARENASGGTDHGNASVWFVMSPMVAGGFHMGTGWPGLSNLHRNRALEHTVDYRDVYGEILTKHLGHTDLSTLLPGHSYNPVGFLP